MKKLSIITSSYKSEKYLSTYFENITHLDGFGDFEIILILNQPTEQERIISNKYKNRFPKNIQIVEVPLESIGVSTNRGFLIAESEFVTCADVDDIKKSYCYNRQIETLEKNPSVNYTYGDFIVVEKQGVTKGMLVKTIEFEREEATRSSIVGPNHFFRKKMLNKSGFWDEQFKSGADFDFQVRSAFSSDFKKTTGEPLFYYTRYNGSGSASSGELQQIERTVIELRYGIYDKINYRYLPKALEYDIFHVYFNDKKIHISELVPNYKILMEERYKKYFIRGLRKNVVNPLFFEKLSLGARYFIRNPIWTTKKIIKKLRK